MNKVFVYAIAIVALFIFAQIGFATLTAIGSETEPIISVEPSYQKVSLGDELTVNITVDPGDHKIRGADYILSFNNSLLHFDTYKEGTFFNGFDTSYIVDTTQPGRIDYGEAILGSEGEGVNTSGTLTTITFEAIGAGISELNFETVTLVNLSATISNISVKNGTVEIVAPPTSFLVYGYVFYENGSKCNNPHVEITNLDTGKELQDKTNASSNYYQLLLAHGININASETLQFEVTSPDGSQLNTTSHNVTLEEINKGGVFDFNISLAPVQIIFDTGHGTYPSIMGTHEGNFTPKCNITVHQIYTYPCVGTGGHSERVIFRDYETGDTMIDESWGGYMGDYHNITVSPSVKLLKNHVYNYTIITGSYPQIIHNQTCPNDFGTITCTRFVDANGKSYDNWIPAIRLE